MPRDITKRQDTNKQKRMPHRKKNGRKKGTPHEPEPVGLWFSMSFSFGGALGLGFKVQGSGFRV
jgi:hypothetical protein